MRYPTLRLSLATLLVSAAIAGCGGGAATSSAPAPATKGSPRIVRTPPRRAHRQPLGLARLRKVLARNLAVAGAGAEVFDLSTHTELFSLHAAVKRAPASVEKLYTTVALARLFSPSTRLHTRILGTGHLTREGTWRGSLYLRGGGDPTFGDGGFLHLYEHGYGSTPGALIRQLKRRGIRRVSGRVIADASLFDAGRGGPSSELGADIPDFGGQLSALTYDHGSSSARLPPEAFAARQTALTMSAMGLRATAARGTARTPGNALQLAEVSSPPLSVLLRLMNVPSDDLFAEMLTKGLGARFAGRGTIAAGAGVIRQALVHYGVYPKVMDGSGLTRRDRSSPAEVVTLLDRVWLTPVGDLLGSSLPLVGENGTVRQIGVGTAAQGHCIAKTGTLDNVTNLAGVCRSRNRHTLTFALFLDGPSNQRGLMLLSRMVGAIAGFR